MRVRRKLPVVLVKGIRRFALRRRVRNLQHAKWLVDHSREWRAIADDCETWLAVNDR